jgi:hypothetical protein
MVYGQISEFGAVIFTRDVHLLNTFNICKKGIIKLWHVRHLVLSIGYIKLADYAIKLWLKMVGRNRLLPPLRTECNIFFCMISIEIILISDSNLKFSSKMA